MTVKTIYGTRVSCQALERYFGALVNMIFKILPMRENEEDTLVIYIRSLLCELTGNGELFRAIGNDAGFVSILGILQYLQSDGNCPIPIVRREVFRAISICNKLKERYAEAV